MVASALAVFLSAPGWLTAVETKTNTANELKVGMGATDITPPIGYPMSGYYYERGATGVLDPLHAKAIVFDDGKTRVAIVVADLIGISTDLCRLVRDKASAATKIPVEHIMISATHCHTAPDYYADLRRMVSGDTPESGERGKYAERLVSGVAAAIEQAAANSQPSSLLVGAGTEQTVSFNRRFVISDGSIRTWANFQDPSVVRAAGPIDPALDILLIKDRDDGRLRGSLGAFALHLDTTGGSQFSADFPYHMERMLQQTLGADFKSVFAAGTCGDINHVNPRSKDRNKPYVIGSRLGDAFLKEVDTLRTVKSSLCVKRHVVSVPMKSFTEKELVWALDLIAKDKAGAKLPFLDEVKAYNIRLLALLRDGTGSDNEGGQGWGTSSSLVGIGESMPVEVQVIQVGEDTAVVALPGEVFVELGLAIKQASPYRNTIVIELANSDESGYIPTRIAYQGGGYEVINSVFQPGGGEKLVDAAIELLREMKSANKSSQQ